MKFSSSTVQTSYASPLGPIILAASGDQLVGLWFDGQAHQLNRSHWPDGSGQPVLQRAKSQLGEYFAGLRTSFDLPLSLASGSAFQQAVWRALLNIAPGTTCSYADLSSAIGKPAARYGRAVGGAVGRNPLSIIVPCHRVIGANGALTGYAGGLQRKNALLQLEGAR